MARLVRPRYCAADATQAAAPAGRVMPETSPGMTTKGAAAKARSEVELVDVALVEDERRAEQDFAAVDHLQLAELAGLDFDVAPAFSLPSTTARITYIAA